MYKLVNVEDIVRSEKEEYVKQNVFTLTERCSDDELNQLYMAVEASVSSMHKG